MDGSTLFDDGYELSASVVKGLEEQSAEWAFGDKDAFLEGMYAKYTPDDFYRYLFPEGSFECLGHPEDKRGNGIVISINEETRRARKTILTDGHEQLAELLKEPFVVCSPISYFGRSRRADHALWLHALALDIDYVNEVNLRSAVHWIENMEIVARPTFIVNSGHGIHLYYVFEHPIAMYETNQRELLKLKKGLVDETWTKYTSYRPDRKEALGIVQGFRMVGSRTKMGLGSVLSAFKSGDRVTVEYLNGFVRPEFQAHVDQPSLFTLEDAKREWPDWYERRVVKGELPGRWHVKRDLYDWFLRQVYSGGKVGHRYFCMMCLAIYAAKCDVDEDELRRDASALQQHLNSLGDKTGEPFEWAEAEKALECYNERYVKFPRATIERITAIPMPANKRNGRSQEQHIKMVNATRRMRKDVLGEDEYRNNGRPPGSGTKRDAVLSYKAAHPGLSNRKIAEDLGVSRNTVNKWLKTVAKI